MDWAGSDTFARIRCILMIVYGINVWCVLVPGKDLIMASIVARQIHETADETAALAAEDLRPEPFAHVNPRNNLDF